MTHATTPPRRIGRRSLVTGAGALLLVPRPGTGPSPFEHFAYVGSTAPQGGTISLFRVNTGDGVMRRVANFAAEHPSWLALNPAQDVLYAVAETAQGRIAAFAIDRAGGTLTPINVVDSGGAAPCFVSVHPSGRHVLAVNTASVVVIPVGEKGALGTASDVRGDAAARFRMVAPDRHGRFIVASDAGRDRILRYSLDPASGKLAPVGTPATAEPGSAPGRFAFHPNGRTLYSLQERDGHVVVYDYNPDTAAMTPTQNVSSLAPDFAGSFRAAGIVVSEDGRFVHASLCRHDAIVTFLVGEGGHLTRIGETWTEGGDPRSFAFAPGGAMLFVCNARSDDITSFRVNRLQGALDFVGHYAPAVAPRCIVFLG